MFTFVGGKLLPNGEEQELSDNMVIRLSNDRMLTAVFLREFASSTDWQPAVFGRIGIFKSLIMFQKPKPA